MVFEAFEPPLYEAEDGRQDHSIEDTLSLLTLNQLAKCIPHIEDPEIQEQCYDALRNGQDAQNQRDFQGVREAKQFIKNKLTTLNIL